MIFFFYLLLLSLLAFFYLFELLLPKDFALHLDASRTLHSQQKLMMMVLLTHIYIHSFAEQKLLSEVPHVHRFDEIVRATCFWDSWSPWEWE